MKILWKAVSCVFPYILIIKNKSQIVKINSINSNEIITYNDVIWRIIFYHQFNIN